MAYPTALIDSVFFNGIRTSPRNSFATRKANNAIAKEVMEECDQLFMYLDEHENDKGI